MSDTNTLSDVVALLREINDKPAPVIFTDPAWNGMCLRVESTGDLAVGEDSIQVLKLALQMNESAGRSPDPRSLAHQFMGTEIVSARSVLTDPNHPLFDRVRPLAGALLKAALASQESEAR